MPKFINLVGRKFGRLTVVKKEETGLPRSWWLCLCDCGKETISSSTILTSGDKKSCGCLKDEGPSRWLTKHGHAQNGKCSRTYNSWKSMIGRCYNPSTYKYSEYGGRGIVVCESWKNDFVTFLHDMGERPERMELERNDTNGNYEPANCKWTTKSQNNRNRRNNLIVEWNGQSKCLVEWSESQKIEWHTLYNRIFLLKWDLSDAMTRPVKSSKETPG